MILTEERGCEPPEEAGLCGKCFLVGEENFEHGHSRAEGANREEETVDQEMIDALPSPCTQHTGLAPCVSVLVAAATNYTNVVVCNNPNCYLIVL